MKATKENEERRIDDVVDDIIREAAPDIVKAIREQEVDEDVNEFYEGAIDAVDDLESYMDYRFPHEEKYEEEPTDSDLYRAGYAYGEANFDKIRKGLQDIVDADTRKNQVLQAISEFEGRITEEAIINALEQTYSYGKEQMGDIHGLIKIMQKKYGWKGYAAFVGIEIFEHALLPAMLSTINPAFGIIAVVPTVEIIAAAGLAYYKKYVKEPEPEQPHVPGHLDWYEEQQNLQAGHKRNTMRLTETKLRHTIRRIITESLGSPEQQKLAELFGAGDIKSVNQAVLLGEALGDMYVIEQFISPAGAFAYFNIEFSEEFYPLVEPYLQKIQQRVDMDIIPEERRSQFILNNK